MQVSYTSGCADWSKHGSRCEIHAIHNRPSMHLLFSSACLHKQISWNRNSSVFRPSSVFHPSVIRLPSSLYLLDSDREKISKQHSSYKLQPKVFKLFLIFSPNDPRQNYLHLGFFWSWSFQFLLFCFENFKLYASTGKRATVEETKWNLLLAEGNKQEAQVLSHSAGAADPVHKNALKSFK